LKCKKKALKTPLQGIVASLEGMKIRNDREALLHPLFQNYLFLERRPVLPHEETKQQVENTSGVNCFSRWTYDHIENEEELTSVLLKFLKYLKTSAFKYPLSTSSSLLLMM
jgi:hypothetical protein